MVLLVALVAGCAAKHDQAWLDTLRQREAVLPPVQAVAAGEAGFSATVPAQTVGDVALGDVADFLTLSIDSESPIECGLYHDEVESASTLQTLAAEVFEGIEERSGPIVEKTVTSLDAGVIGSSPYLELFWRYRVEKEGREVLGEVKQLIANREGRSIYCVHHENGYAESFRKVFSDLLSTMSFSNYDDLRPYFTQVDVLSDDDGRFGFAVVSVTLDEDGDPRVVHYTTELARGADGAINARDVTEVEHSTLPGALKGKLFTDYRDGEITSSMLLEDLAGVGWQVTGQRAGENARAIFEAPRLASWLDDARVLRALVEGKEVAMVAHPNSPAWLPGLDWENASARALEVADPLEDGRYAASLVLGDRDQALVVDADGLVHSALDQRDGRQVLRQRVYTEGALR